MHFNFHVALAVLLAQALFALQARANHFEIGLTISDGNNNKQEGKTETEPPAKAGEVPVRPVLKATFGDRCTATWKLTSNSKETLKDILVHFYVVRIDRAGQNPPPLEPGQVVIETAQSFDIAYHGSSAASLEFLPDHPGIYLCRVETQGSAEAKGHEHYAAIELTVK